jgi:NADPH-dependent 7-cyano-7-deazaguanine reductase QueF-like protein
MHKSCNVSEYVKKVDDGIIIIYIEAYSTNLTVHHTIKLYLNSLRCF